MTVIASILFFIGVIALACFFPSFWNDKKSSAAGTCLKIAIPCLVISWALFGFPI